MSAEGAGREGSFREQLIRIAGENAIGIGDERIARLCRCLSYLDTQLGILANDDEMKESYGAEHIPDLRRIAAGILGAP